MNENPLIIQNSEEKKAHKFKERLKSLNFIGHDGSKKLLEKYGDAIETAINKFESKRELQNLLREGLGSYFPRLVGAWEQYRDGEIDKTFFISSGILLLVKKFIDIFIKDSQEVLRVRRRNVYFTLNGIFLSMVAFCLVYFLLLMPIDVSKNPEGQFRFPGPENFEWVFTIIMSVLMIIFFGYLASSLLSTLTIKIYVRMMRKDQRLGLIPTKNLFGKALYRKLLYRAIIAGFLVYNVSMILASNKAYISFMRNINPDNIQIIPDPELMIQSMWISLIPIILLLVPVWLMMDIGIAKTKYIHGFELESVNLAGSKLYKLIKGYAGVTFLYNLVIITFVWASDEVPFIRIFMRIISPLIVISFSFPLVVIIDHKNELFKKKLWGHLKKYDINRKLIINIHEEQISNYNELLGY